MKTARAYILFTSLIFFLPSCHTPRAHDRKVIISAARLGISPEQYVHFRKYCEYRDKVSTFLHLTPKASPDDIRRHAAERLGVSKNSTWESLLTNPVICVWLTEKKRVTYSGFFGLSTNTSWIGLKDYLENLRNREKAHRQ